MFKSNTFSPLAAFSACFVTFVLIIANDAMFAAQTITAA